MWKIYSKKGSIISVSIFANSAILSLSAKSLKKLKNLQQANHKASACETGGMSALLKVYTLQLNKILKLMLNSEVLADFKRILCT